MRKAGLILNMRVRQFEEVGLVKQMRVPDLALRESAEKLLCDSFAPELKELIGVGVEAAFQQTLVDASTVANGKYVFKDAAKGVCVDLSSCRLWMSAFDPSVRMSDMWFMKDRLISAVLWRLLDGWTGAPDDALGVQVRP